MNNLPNDRVQDKPFDQPTVKIGGGGHPEKEPISEAHLKEAEEKPELSPELQKAGIEHIEGEIRLSSQDKTVGMEEAGAATPVSTQPTQTISLPLTEDQIEIALHQKITNSIVWLATWCLRRMKLIHHIKS